MYETLGTLSSDILNISLKLLEMSHPNKLLNEMHNKTFSFFQNYYNCDPMAGEEVKRGPDFSSVVDKNFTVSSST